MGAVNEQTREVHMRTMQREAHANARRKGFWSECEVQGCLSEERVHRAVPTKLALIHSEVSEALEEYREGRAFVATRFAKGGKPEGMGAELADVVIRVFDLAHALGFDMHEEIAAKMAYNLGRPHMHGGKLA
jgi:NTP pyrophosphatase (non-canonical NTP hydrolase)